MLLGNVVYAAGLWLRMMVFAHIGGALALGTYAYALALTAPVMMFSYLQLRALVASDASAAYPFRAYRRLRVVMTASGLLVIAVVASSTADSRATWPVLIPVCAMRAADALADIYHGLWQRHERMSVIGWGLVINSVASVALMAGAALLGGGATGVAAGGAVGAFAAFIYVRLRTAVDPVMREELKAEAPSYRRVARLAVEAAPLGVIVLLASLLQNVPRYFIRHYGGETALGLFAAAYQLTTAGGVMVGALGSSALPRLARACAARDVSAFVVLSRRLALGGAALGAVGVAASFAFGRQLLIVLFQPEFGSAAGALIVLSIAAGLGFVVTLLGAALTAARAIAVQPVLLGVSLAVAVAACAVLVPAKGGLGAAWAVVIASGIQVVWSAVALARARMRYAPAAAGLAPSAAARAGGR
jgi:O-antigen/teichoic acid export membrane protein